MIKKSGVNTMEPKDKILAVMGEAGKPLSAGEVVKLSGLEKSVVDKAFKELKKENAIVSPVRCKWEPAS
jgi:predicted transcriptional regulator